MKRIYLIMGESGSGKTALSSILEKVGFDVLKSYTSRPKRFADEGGHIFITPKKSIDYRFGLFRNSIVAYTEFDGYDYFATKKQIYENDIYIVDPDGIRFLKNYFKDDADIKIVTIYLKVSLTRRICRMLKRGDKLKVIKRLFNDFKKFKHKEYDYIIENEDIMTAVQTFKDIVWQENSNFSFSYIPKFTCECHFDTTDNIYHGKLLNIEDSVTFEGKTMEELRNAFEESVCDYIKTCVEMGKFIDIRKLQQGDKYHA